MAHVPHLFVGVQEIPSLKVKVDDYTHHTGRCVLKGMHIYIFGSCAPTRGAWMEHLGLVLPDVKLD